MKIKTKNISKMLPKRDNGIICRHDYKNAIKVGNVDYACPLCKKLLDPLEWFFMNSFEFVEVSSENKKVTERSRDDIAGGARKKLEKRLGRSVVSKNNFKTLRQKKGELARTPRI